MTFQNKIKRLFLISSLININICFSDTISDHIKVVGEKTIGITINQHQKNNDRATFNSSSSSKTKEITLLNIELDSHAKSALKKRMQRILKEKDKLSFSSSASTDNSVVDLGMNNVPVFDQGMHGTCVTFSVTAAIDALYNLDDYISQQCLLEVGLYKYYFFQTNYPGWDGAFVKDVLGRIKYYGVVNKSNCPDMYPNRTKWVFPYTYRSYSLKEPWVKNLNWKNLPEADLIELKKALNNGNRVVISNILYLQKAFGYPINNKNNGLWDIPSTKEEFVKMMNDILWNTGNSLGGHAIIVTGYDDNQKTLKIRNSWGEDVGDQGEFYMSYDFYELFNIMATEIFSDGQEKSD